METAGTIQRRIQEGGVIACKICGTPTRMLATKLCKNCWEVKRRLRSFISTPEGLKFIKSMIEREERRKA